MYFWVGKRFEWRKTTFHSSAVKKESNYSVPKSLGEKSRTWWQDIPPMLKEEKLWDDKENLGKTKAGYARATPAVQHKTGQTSPLRISFSTSKLKNWGRKVEMFGWKKNWKQRFNETKKYPCHIHESHEVHVLELGEFHGVYSPPFPLSPLPHNYQASPHVPIPSPPTSSDLNVPTSS